MWADLAPLVQPSLAALLALVVVALLTGRLVPKATADERVAAEQRRFADITRRAEAAEQRADRLSEYVHALLPHAEVATLVLREMRRAVEATPADSGIES